ncbi:MAG TPA: TIM barrel protein [Alphaproteobacteria bacterium]|nr:TIM barrel protein [Alphaproteobacteria bacterium]
MAHPLCLDFLTAIEASPPDLARLAAANGCASISFMVHPVEGVPDFGMDRDTPMRRETRARCKDLGIGIDMVEGFLLTPETDVARFRPSLESAAWLGSKCINAVFRDTDIGRLADRFAQLADEAASFELEALTEWSIRTPLKTLSDAALFITRLRRPSARLQFDSLHLFRGGFSAGDLAQIEPHLIGRAQLSDGPAEMPVERQYTEAIGGRLPPGEGALPLRSFVHALPDGITLGIEVPMSADAGPPAERVRRAVEGARKVLTA